MNNQLQKLAYELGVNQALTDFEVLLQEKQALDFSGLRASAQMGKYHAGKALSAAGDFIDPRKAWGRLSSGASGASKSHSELGDLAERMEAHGKQKWMQRAALKATAARKANLLEALKGAGGLTAGAAGVGALGYGGYKAYDALTD